MTDHAPTVPLDRVATTILRLRGQNVMLDADLAELYGVETKVLNQAVRRNLERFPEDFMFQLSQEEAAALRSQSVTLDAEDADSMTLHSGPARPGRGRYRKYSPYAFTEQGVAMLSGVLSSPRAVQVNIEIMRAFVRMRQVLASHAGLARKLDALESKYDEQFRVVFEAIRALMRAPERSSRPLGFRPEGG